MRIFKIPVLIVDDDNMNRMVIKMHLNKEKYRIFEAENGLEAYNLVVEHKEIVHVVLDLNMPVMDGFTFLNQCYKTIPERNLKIHITSAYAQKEFLAFVAARTVNTSLVVNYFEKPYPMNLLIDCLI